MEKIKAGLIGCGRIGYTFDLDSKRQGVWTHAGAYHASDEVEFVGVYDTNPDQATECAEKYDVRVFKNVDEAIRKCDIISVAIPEKHLDSELRNMAHIFEKETKTPKVLWIEKPFTARFHSARSHVDIFARFNCQIHINYQRRFCPSFDMLKDYGEPQSVTMVYVRGLYNTASHFVDMIIGLYGMPTHGIIKISETDFTMQYQFFNVSFIMLKNSKYNMCDTTFYYHDKVVHAPPLQTHLNIRKVISSNQYSEYGDLAKTVRMGLEYEPMLVQVEMLADSIKKNKYLALNNGLETLQILEGIRSDKGQFSL